MFTYGLETECRALSDHELFEAHGATSYIVDVERRVVEEVLAHAVELLETHALVGAEGLVEINSPPGKSFLESGEQATLGFEDLLRVAERQIEQLAGSEGRQHVIDEVVAVVEGPAVCIQIRQ